MSDEGNHFPFCLRKLHGDSLEVHDSSVLAGALSLSTTVVLRVTGAEEKA
jgi:hypothetical protein